MLPEACSPQGGMVGGGDPGKGQSTGYLWTTVRGQSSAAHGQTEKGTGLRLDKLSFRFQGLRGKKSGNRAEVAGARGLITICRKAGDDYTTL